jgi:hypothetical protein
MTSQPSQLEQRYTAAEDAAIIKHHEVDKFTWPFIATLLGRASHRGVRLRYLRLTSRPAAPTGTMRHCIRTDCRKPFLSPHCGVRMCDDCRDRSESPFEPDDVGHVSYDTDCIRPAQYGARSGRFGRFSQYDGVDLEKKIEIKARH